MAENLSSSNQFNWVIKNFSKLNPHERTYSDVFSVGSFKWRAAIYPKGKIRGYYDQYMHLYNQYLSLSLYPVDLKIPVDTDFTFAVTSQSDPYINRVQDLTKEFPVEGSGGWGWDKFMRASLLHDPNKGYIVNDTCVIVVEVTCRTKDVSQGYPNEDKVAKTKSEKQTKEKDDKSSLESGGYPGAGQPFGDGRHDNNIVGFGNEGEFEDVGGFSIMKTQAPLYTQIWLKYGHIPSTKVMPISMYPLLVMVVKDLMNCISDMHQCRYVELSSKMIEHWEERIVMAEKNEFNVGWLRGRLETVKKGMGGMQNVKTELLEHGQPLRAAKEKMKIITEVMKRVEVQVKKVEVELVAAKANARENTRGLLSESDMELYLEIGENLLLDGLF